MSQKIKNLTYKNLKLANPITRKDMKYLITLILFRQQIFKYIDKLLKIITTHQEKKKKTISSRSCFFYQDFVSNNLLISRNPYHYSKKNPRFLFQKF